MRDGEGPRQEGRVPPNGAGSLRRRRRWGPGKNRERLGIAREQLGVAGHYVNILFEADLKSLIAGREFNVCFLRRPEFEGLLHAFDDGRRWCFQLVDRRSRGETHELLSPDRCVRLVREAVGIPDLEVHLVGAQPWEEASAIADAYRRGRVMLAGDAAHQMTPFLGLGAATGIQDAHNLAWKLALVLRGIADASLLDSYETERRPVARQAVIASSNAGDGKGLPLMDPSIYGAGPWALLGLDYQYRSRDRRRSRRRGPAWTTRAARVAAYTRWVARLHARPRPW